MKRVIASWGNDDRSFIFLSNNLVDGTLSQIFTHVIVFLAQHIRLLI